MLLQVRALQVRLGRSFLVRDVSFELRAGQVHALVGESGSGKTSVAKALVGLLPSKAVVQGSMLLEGTELVGLGSKAQAALRGRRVALIPQEALSSLNPVLTVSAQLLETLRVHQPAQATPAAAIALLEAVGLPSPPQVMAAYPHQLSGGMRQRVLVAAALACGPSLLIADEPTTALDAALKTEVLALFRSLARLKNLGILVISHDLDAMERAADSLSVLYAGRVVEQGSVQVLQRPRHPYTQALLQARPGAQGFRAIAGMAPSADDELVGCPFRPRCAQAGAGCEVLPVLEALPGSSHVACVHPVPA